MTELNKMAETSINNNPACRIQKQIKFYEEQYKYCGFSSERLLSMFYKALKDPKLLQEYEEGAEHCRAAAFVLHMQVAKELVEYDIGNQVPAWIMRGLAVFARRYEYDFLDVYREFKGLADQYELEALSIKSCSADFVMRKYCRATEIQMRDEARARAYFSLEEKFFLRIPINHTANYCKKLNGFKKKNTTETHEL